MVNLGLGPVGKLRRRRDDTDEGQSREQALSRRKDDLGGGPGRLQEFQHQRPPRYRSGERNLCGTGAKSQR